MNDILFLSKRFQSKRKTGNGYGFQTSVCNHETIMLEKLKSLISQLKSIKDFWDQNSYLKNSVLVSSYEKKILAKSNRLERLFEYEHKTSSDSMVGARFYSYNGKRAHLFTYLLTKDELISSINLFEKYISVFSDTFGSEASQKQLESAAMEKRPQPKSFSMTDFYQLTHELSFIEKFDIYRCNKKIEDKVILVTLYKTNTDTIELLKKIGINVIQSNLLNSTTVLMNKDNYDLLLSKAPYLVSMSVKNFMDSVKESGKAEEFKEPLLPNPTNEPTIGVIDTFFDGSSYFHNFVTVDYRIDPNITLKPEDSYHGTAVDSLIVDLPDLDPDLDDGCGYFKVKHFAVATSNGNSIFSLMTKIKDIIIQNYNQIHVWNLSLGSNMEIDENCISPVAALIDDLQVKYGVIFVVAGTNKGNSDKKDMRIGSPADSINSVVVNSVTKDNKPAPYCRFGPALGFFIKPDLSYYGGDSDYPLNVYYDRAKHTSSGTSFAAPLISRKLCYLIDVLKIDRETAKALLINSAMSFDCSTEEDIKSIGHGIVPIKISDIVGSKDDEIKFMIKGSSKKFYTYDYSLPIPQENDRFPYAIKATLCYFPTCNRSQGVDYTGTELNLNIGKAENDKFHLNKIKLLAKDSYLTEEEARNTFRKWDNVKNIKTKYSHTSGMTAKEGTLWGIQIAYYDRNAPRDNNGDLPEIHWGLVVTLKALDHKNRYDSFIHECSFHQWLVTPISLKESVKTYIKLNEDIHLE